MSLFDAGCRSEPFYVSQRRWKQDPKACDWSDFTASAAVRDTINGSFIPRKAASIARAFVMTETLAEWRPQVNALSDATRTRAGPHRFPPKADGAPSFTDALPVIDDASGPDVKKTRAQLLRLLEQPRAAFPSDGAAFSLFSRKKDESTKIN